MTDKAVKIDKSKNFDEKGHFKKGNVIGRMPKEGFNLTDLNKLVREYEEARGKKRDSLLKHYIRRLFRNDYLLARYMDKNIPTKTISELTGAGGEPIRYIIEPTYEKPNKGNTEEKAEETEEAKSG